VRGGRCARRARGEAVAAFVRLAPGASLGVEALKAHWEAVASWPSTGSGKIKKFELRESWIADDG